MKKCAYCNIDLTKKIKTKEHVIPNGLIKLFPNQNITFTHDKAYKDNTGQTISDVCNNCNNVVLSELDTYGVNLIKDNFLAKFKPNDTLNISFDYNKLSRWLLKIAFNYERVEKNSCTWFKRNLDYINGKSTKSEHFSIFGGLHVDMNPMGEENDLYLPLNIGVDLKFYDAGISSYGNLINGNVSKSNYTPLIFENIYKTYSFRFASSKFILILWEKDTDINYIKSTEDLIESLFPYQSILSNDSVKLERANDTISGRFSNLITGYVGMSTMDKFIESMIPNLEETQKYFTESLKRIDSNPQKLVEAFLLDNYN